MTTVNRIVKMCHEANKVWCHLNGDVSQPSWMQIILKIRKRKMRRETMTTVNQIAKMCHEANKVWCHLNGDVSQPSWMDAPQWQIDSAISGVEFALAAPNAQPEDSHRNWMAGKIADGWVYGEVKDPAAKTHPCMVPYDQLPVFQRKKDALFLAIVRALA